MDFTSWATTAGYDVAKLTDKQRQHLEHAWRVETNQIPVAALIDPMQQTLDHYCSVNPAKRHIFQGIAQRAAAENWDHNRLKLELLREDRMQPPMFPVPRTTVGNHEILATALLLTADPRADERLHVAGVPDQVLSAARSPQYAGFSLKALVRMALSQMGEHVHGDIAEHHVKKAFEAGRMMAAGPSTINVPSILLDAAQKTASAAYMTAPAAWRTFAAVRSCSDFKTHHDIRPTYAATAAVVPPQGEIQHGSITDEKYTYSIETYARLLSIDRRHIIDDDLGIFTSGDNNTIFGLARGAARALNNLVATTILANAGTFWGTAAGNYFEGAATNLSAGSLGTALQTLRKMKDAEGNYLDLQPAALLVPGELEQTARELLESSELLRDGSADQQPSGNIYRGLAQLAVEPRLSDSALTGNSATAWWLFSAASNAAVVVAFLNGIQQPTLETFDFRHEAERLAMTFRVYHDFGCALGDFRSSVKSKGAA